MGSRNLATPSPGRGQGETTVVTVAREDEEGKLIPFERMADSRGLSGSRTSYREEKPESPLCLLSLKHRPSEAWKGRFDGQFDRRGAGPEWVEVPAGRFRTIRVEQTMNTMMDDEQGTSLGIRGCGTGKDYLPTP